jgi:hypothetical protein|tara:strand:- start:3693 stop:3845 length:153 start_codon:yes stop_codon:yes gene_type:complete
MKIRNGFAYYTANITEDDAPLIFKIPVVDMGDAEFIYLMDAKHLIRWLVV